MLIGLRFQNTSDGELAMRRRIFCTPGWLPGLRDCALFHCIAAISFDLPLIAAIERAATLSLH